MSASIVTARLWRVASEASNSSGERPPDEQPPERGLGVNCVPVHAHKYTLYATVGDK